MHSTQERPPSFFSNPFQPSQGTQHFELQDQDDYNRYEQPLTLGGNRHNSVQPHTPEEVVLDFTPTSVDTVANPRANVTDREPATTTATILDVTEPNVPLQPPEPVFDALADQNLLERIITSILKEVVKWNIVNTAVFVVILSAIKWKLSYISVLVLLWLYNTYNIVMLSHATLRGSRRNKRINILAIFNNVLSALFKVLVVIQIQTDKMSVTIPLLPLLISEISLSLAKFLKNKKTSTAFFYQVEIVFKLFVILQAFVFALKVDNIITWNWREVLCIYWILFAIMIGITFAFVIMLVGKCCTYLFAEMEVYEVRGVIWLVAVIGGKTILSYLLVRRVLKVLDGEKSIEYVMGIMATIAVYSLGLSLYTIFFYSGIEDLWKKVAAIGAIITEEEVAISEKQIPSPKKEPEKIEIPKFLTKFSGTYFRRATGEEIQKVKEKKKKEGEDAKQKNNNNNNANKPQKMRRRQNSLDTSKSRLDKSNNTTNIGLLTVHETEGERTKTTIEWNNTSRFGLRVDKGKDFFANFTDRSGVSGIIPSNSAINSKTDRYQIDGLTSNDSYILPPTSKDTEVPTKFVRPNKKKDFTADNTADMSPGARGRDDIIEESFENSLPADVHFRRVQSMQDISAPQVISLSEALESPKVKNSVIPDHPEPLMSPVSEGSKEVQCLICFDNPPDAVFMECGHGGVCYECSLEIWKTTGECYLCRNKIIQVLQVDIKSKLGNNVIKVLSSTQMVLYDEDNE